MLGSISNIKPLIILGAGASYDLIDDYKKHQIQEFWDFRPPLVNDIFSDRRGFQNIQRQFSSISDVMGLIEDRMQSNGESLEEIVETWHKDDREKKLKDKILNFKNYLKKLFKEISEKNKNIPKNNYSKFIAYLDKIVGNYYIVNFNYDSILREVLKTNQNYIEANDQLGNFHTNHSASPINLIQIHGNCDWRDKNGDPIICLPIINKNQDNFVCSKFDLNQLSGYLLTTNTIIIIGWRGNENHFQKLLMGRLDLNKVKRIIIVDEEKNDEDEEIKKEAEKKTAKQILNNSGLIEIFLSNKPCELLYIGGFSNLFKEYTDFSESPKRQHLIHYSQIQIPPL